MQEETKPLEKVTEPKNKEELTKGVVKKSL